MLDPVLVISPEKDAPALSIYINPLYSLYHYLTKEARLVPWERYPATAQAASSLAEVRNPLGSFDVWQVWEQPLTIGSTSAEAVQGLRAIMNESVDKIGYAIASAEEIFMQELWPQRQRLINAALATLQAYLVPHFSSMARRQAELLSINWPERIDAFLVTDCYAWQGAYSHPLTVDIEHNHGLYLCEALLHEATHVGDHYSIEQSCRSPLEDHLLARLEAETTLSFNQIWQVWHAFNFASSAFLVRSYNDPDHKDYALNERDLYSWFNVPGLPAIWSDFASGILSEQELLDRIVIQLNEILSTGK